MKTVKLEQVQESPEVYAEIHRILERGGLVCLPCNGTYRIVADLTNEDAVTRLFQSKHRVKKAPSLVFVDDVDMLKEVVHEISPQARELSSLWPGPLTILFDLNPSLPSKIKKQLGKGKIGVRVPDSRLMRDVISALGRPILVSSANRERKPGAESPAQIRKNFNAQVDMFIDAGDLPREPSSTVVDLSGPLLTVTRQGALEEQLLRGLLA